MLLIDLYVVTGGRVQGLINVFQVSSTWLTVNMALGRYFAICRPLHARGYINARGTRLTVALIFIGATIFNLPRFWHYRAVETPCDWLLAGETDNTTSVLLDQPPGCRCFYYSKVGMDTDPAYMPQIIVGLLPATPLTCYKVNQ